MMEEPYGSKTENQQDEELDPVDSRPGRDDDIAPEVVRNPEQLHYDVNEGESSSLHAKSVHPVTGAATITEQQEPVASDRSNLQQQQPQTIISKASTDPLESTIEEITESIGNVDVSTDKKSAVPIGTPENNSRDSKPQTVANEEITSLTGSRLQVKTNLRSAQPSLESSVFKVRSIKWFDPYGQMRESPIILQNENGPCPLLALVNTLILSTAPGQETPLSRISTTRTEINALYLLELLGDLLLSSAVAASTDVNNVLSLLPSLHTGLNINPRFDGTFEESEELALFRAFEVDLVHGWVSNPDNSYVHNALMKAASYEGAQGILVAMSELATTLDKGEPLTTDEVLTMERGRIIDHFLNQTATQLTPFGLNFLTELLLPGSFAVLFRNDHFSTIYRHPDAKQIFMLVTDAGFSSHKNIVWESLNDVTGSSSLFFNGMFIPSEFGDAEPEKKDNSPQVDDKSHVPATAVSFVSHDDDYALARELQMNEDRAMALEEARREQEEEARRSAHRAERQRATQFAQTQPSQYSSSKGRRTTVGSTSSRRPSRPLTVFAPYFQEARNLLSDFQSGTPSAPSATASRQSGNRPVATSSSSKRTASDKDKCLVM
ncbi:hypothetical protein V1525DRAFT_398227 [Lipomyces kononenkoae]|uniref:Uncharacterized protein n=1 Tax=Lipomyces kononenkoae TaxID=34357 RepID=A0ACC3T699_LIPKO